MIDEGVGAGVHLLRNVGGVDLRCGGGRRALNHSAAGVRACENWQEVRN